MMKRKVFEEKWKMIRAQTPGWWSLMSEFDLKKVDKAAPYKLDKYATMLRVKYGYTVQEVKDEINKRVDEFEAQQEETD
jgi:hypothetical protein